MKTRMKRLEVGRMFFVWFCFGSLFCSHPVFGAEVSGVQTGRWTLAASPYIVSGDVTVPEGQVLTIEPGVIVKFAGKYSFVVDGILRANGGETNRIIFTSINDQDFGFQSGSTTTPGNSDWNGIRFSDSINPSLSQIQNVIIRYANQPLQFASRMPVVATKITMMDCGVNSVSVNGRTVAYQNGVDQTFSSPTNSEPAQNQQGGQPSTAAPSPAPASNIPVSSSTTGQDATEQDDPFGDLADGFSFGEMSLFTERIEVNAFGDMTFGMVSGEVASTADAALFNSFGLDKQIKNVNDGFGIVGTDFVVTVDLSENLIYQAEINLQVERGSSSEFELDSERFYLDYRINDQFNVQAGLFFTPIGFVNRNLYARAWLMKSVQLRDAIEEEFNFAPTHSVGVNFYGGLPVSDKFTLNYAFSIANGRGIDPTINIYSRDKVDNGKEFTGLFELVMPSFEDFRIGMSAFTGSINSYKVDAIGASVDMDNPTTERIELSEMGIMPYFVLHSSKFNLLAEFALIRHEDQLGNLSQSHFTASMITGEISLNLMENKLHPYLRYDKTDLPENGGPYYGLRADENILTRYFVPEFEAAIVGVAYDLYALNRIKLEYIHHLDGPRRKHGVVLQTAFGF